MSKLEVFKMNVKQLCKGEDSILWPCLYFLCSAGFSKLGPKEPCSLLCLAKSLFLLSSEGIYTAAQNSWA